MYVDPTAKTAEYNSDLQSASDGVTEALESHYEMATTRDIQLRVSYVPQHHQWKVFLMTQMPGFFC